MKKLIIFAILIANFLFVPGVTSAQDTVRKNGINWVKTKKVFSNTFNCAFTGGVVDGFTGSLGYRYFFPGFRLDLNLFAGYGVSAPGYGSYARFGGYWTMSSTKKWRWLSVGMKVGFPYSFSGKATVNLNQWTPTNQTVTGAETKSRITHIQVSPLVFATTRTKNHQWEFFVYYTPIFGQSWAIHGKPVHIWELGGGFRFFWTKKFLKDLKTSLNWQSPETPLFRRNFT